MGLEPAEDVATTEEQVSAVKQILDCDRFPYACFSIFGPYGKCMLVKMVCLAYLFMQMGHEIHIVPSSDWYRLGL